MAGSRTYADGVVQALCTPWTHALTFLKSITSTFDGRNADVDLASLSDVQTQLHAEGAMGALFVISSRHDSSNVAVVLKASKDTSHGCSGRRSLSDVCPYEVDISMFLWDLLATTGASLHIVCPYAVLRIIPPRALSFGSKPVNMLAMEKLTGIATLDGTRVYNLQDLIVQGIKGRIADFAAIFKTVLFQVFYTVTTWTYLTDGLFRHNDLYARNIGLSTLPNEDGIGTPSLSYVVHTCRKKDAPLVKMTFSIETSVRAVILDFGWSALLPKLGPRRDSRFFQQCRTGTGARLFSKKLQVRPVVADSGMSQSLFSHHYDCTLLMVSCYMLVRREPEARLPPVLAEFKAVYEATYSRLHESDMMHGEHLVGRLTNAAQTSLNAGSKLTCNPRSGRSFDPFVISVPHAREILALPFFACFRSSAVGASSLCLGIDMGSISAKSAAIRLNKIIVQMPTRRHTSQSPIAPTSATLEAEFSTGLWKQATGSYEELLARASDIYEKYRRAAVRNMTVEEVHMWLSASTPGFDPASASVSVSTSVQTLKRGRCDVEDGARKRASKPEQHQRSPSCTHIDDVTFQRRAVGQQKKILHTTPNYDVITKTVYFEPLTPILQLGIETVRFVSMTPL